MASSKKAPVSGKVAAGKVPGGKTSGAKPAGGSKPSGGKAATGGKPAGARKPPGGATKPSSTKATGPAPAGPPGGLVALVDGVALPDAEGAALWHAFSEHMDQHQGDLAGFAKARGYASVKPEYRRGQAVLVVSTR